MKKKIMAMVFAAMMMVGAVFAQQYVDLGCAPYSEPCPNGADGGATGIACGTLLEQIWQVDSHILDNCYGYVNSLDFFPPM